jgi:hypothetical protein
MLLTAAANCVERIAAPRHMLAAVTPRSDDEGGFPGLRVEPRRAARAIGTGEPVEVPA